MAENSARERVLDALLDIIAGQGLERVTIREVAAGAGVSIGTVQYYGRSKEEMLRLAFEHVVDSALSRADAIPREGRVGEVVRTALREFLPLDDTRVRETRVYLAFAARALVVPALAERQQAIMGRLRALGADAVRLAQERGEALPETDAELFGIATVALLDGLSLQLLTDPGGIDAETALRLADLHVARAFRMDAASR
jgi:AcrR family transcriptional regulator